MCVGATTLCDYQGAPTDTAFWVWTRRYDPSLPAASQAAWVRQDGFACLGGDAPGVPIGVQIAAIVQRDFQSFVVISGRVTVNPATTTLINVDTIFSTDKAGPEPLQGLPLILGHRVDIVVTPSSYDWSFGDGSHLQTSTPGTPRQKEVTHIYRGAASVAVSVTITWTGTYAIDGGQPLPITGTATTTGPAVPLRVATARSELVAR
jgi:hypothetical protein